MFIEVESNPSWENSIFLRFKELGPAKPVTHVRIYDRVSRGEWCAVTGLTDNSHDPTCQAFAQKVEDSGAGMTYIVFGGNWGLRLKLEESQEDWNLDHSNQWGEAYLSLSDQRDLRYKDS